MKRPPSLQRLFKFYILTVSVMLAMYYILVYAFNVEQQQRHSQIVFARLAHELIDHSDHRQASLKSILKKPFLKDTSYQLMLMTPSGQTYIHSYYRSEDTDISSVTLPQQIPLHSDNQFMIDKQKLSGWIKLDSGYQVYVNIYHQPISINWSSYRYWSPLLVALVLLMIALTQVIKRLNDWEELIHYTESLALFSKESYFAPSFIDRRVPKEFLRLGHALSRVNYQLHKSYRRTQLLEHRLERLIDHAPLPMLTIKRHGQISFFNRRFEKAFATTFQRGVTYSLTDFVTGSDKATHQTLTKLASQRVTRTLLVTSLEDDQTYQLHIMPWFGDHGQVHGATVLLNNVHSFTEQIKTAESQLQQQQSRLSDFDQLWSVMGHELRTPLSGIISTLDLLSSDNAHSEQLEAIDTLKQTSKTMLTMLNGMLDMAKMDAGKLKVETEEVDLLVLCQQICELMIGNARRQGIELDYFFDPQCPRYLTTDSGRLRQILMNLISNAIKFTPSGFVAVIIEPITTKDSRYIPPARANKPATYLHNSNVTTAYAKNVIPLDGSSLISADTATQDLTDSLSLTDPEPQWICFSIKDTGIGIEKDDQNKLFSYFNQANDSISRQFGGTGLGLAISNSFAQLLGGFIHLKSTPKVGSTFSLCLPWHSPASQPVYQFNSDLSSVCLIAFVNQPISAHYLRQLCNHLLLPGIVRTSMDETAVQQIFQQLTIIESAGLTPILLVDYELYQDSDLTYFNRLTHTAAIPKILLSMMPERGITSQVLNRFEGYLAKPLDIGHLISEITRLTQGARHHPTQSSTSSLTIPPTDSSACLSQSKASPLSQCTATPECSAISDKCKATANSAVTDQSPDLLDHHLPLKPLILVAEDNPVNQKVACKVLEKLGYRTVVAQNGAEAIETLRSLRDDIQLILMDCRMPVLDGIAATRQIRANQDSIPIVALTANNTTEDRDLCLAAGMDSFLAKPLKQSALAKVLRTLLNTNASGPQNKPRLD